MKLKTFYRAKIIVLLKELSTAKVMCDLNSLRNIYLSFMLHMCNFILQQTYKIAEFKVYASHFMYLRQTNSEFWNWSLFMGIILFIWFDLFENKVEMWRLTVFFRVKQLCSQNTISGSYLNENTCICFCYCSLSIFLWLCLCTPPQQVLNQSMWKLKCSPLT